MSTKFLIVGLGNIGTEYDATRHNIGFDVADAFVIKHGGNFELDRHAFVANVKWMGKQFVVIKPTTYMNLSGKAMKYWMDKEKISIDNCLVVVDDLALAIEQLRLRPSGSDAGHNGLKNIQEVLQSKDYPRLRFGIGNNFAKGKQIDFVLAGEQLEGRRRLFTINVVLDGEVIASQKGFTKKDASQLAAQKAIEALGI